VLGTGVYNTSLHRVWTKVFSRMIHIIIPTAVALELRGSKALSTQNSIGGKNSTSRDISASGMYHTTFLSGGAGAGGGAATGGCPEAAGAGKCPLGHGAPTKQEDSASTQDSTALNGRVISHRFASCRSVIEEEAEEALLERLETDSYISAKSLASRFQAEDMVRDAESTRSHQTAKQFRSTFTF
jgi:hypothetical protein